MRRLILPIGVLLLFCSNIAAEEELGFELTPGMKLEQKMVAERLKIKYGKVAVLYLNYRPDNPKEDEEYPQKRRTIYESDGTNSRIEHPNCQRYDYHFNEVSINSENGNFQVVSDSHTTFINRTKRTEPAPWNSVWPPVKFGSRFHYKFAYKIFSRNQSLPVKDRVNHPDRLNEKVTADTLNGISAKHVTYDLPKGKHVEYWIAPEQGYTLLKVIIKSMIKRHLVTIKRFEQREVENIYTYECEWKQYPSGVWFPSRWNDVTKEDNIVTADREHVIEEADFFTPVSPERFSLQAFTNTKKKIRHVENGLRYTEDGIKTLDEYLVYLKEIGGPPAWEEENHAKKWGKTFVAIVLALLAIVLINQRRKNKWGSRMNGE